MNKKEKETREYKRNSDFNRIAKLLLITNRIIENKFNESKSEMIVDVAKWPIPRYCQLLLQFETRAAKNLFILTFYLFECLK